MTERNGSNWNSSATLEATTAAIMVDAADLVALLQPLGLAILPLPDAPARMHPVCVDLWRVVSGRIMLAGVDQHEWSANMGRAAASFAGAWRGAAFELGVSAVRGAANGALVLPMAAASWWLGTAFGGLAAARDAATSDGSVGARAAERWSHRFSDALGTYEEVLIAVPNVVRLGGEGPACTYVAGMLTNSPVSIWGDRVLGCGYRKQFADIRRTQFDTYEAWHDNGAHLKAAFTRDAEFALAPHADAALRNFRAIFRQPLLGYEDGRFVITHLDRSLDERVLWAPAAAEIVVEGHLVPELAAGTYRCTGLSRENPWGAFHSSGVVARLKW